MIDFSLSSPVILYSVEKMHSAEKLLVIGGLLKLFHNQRLGKFAQIPKNFVEASKNFMQKKV
jgi:hypothetical protein